MSASLNPGVWVAVFGASCVLAGGIYFIVSYFCVSRGGRKRRIRCGISDEMRNRLEEFVAKQVKPSMILDGKKQAVKKAGERFDWAVVSDRVVADSERVGQMRVEVIESTIEKTSPTVWSAAVICELTPEANEKSKESSKESSKKELKPLSASLIICHLNERLLFLNDTDDEIERLEDELEKCLKGCSGWIVKLD